MDKERVKEIGRKVSTKTKEILYKTAKSPKTPPIVLFAVSASLLGLNSARGDALFIGISSAATLGSAGLVGIKIKEAIKSKASTPK